MKQRELFIEALQKQTEQELAEFLDQACAGDIELRNDIVQLLAQHKRADEFFLDQPPPGLGNDSSGEFIGEAVGDKIGPYTIREALGEGGMGVVYMATQESPVRRLVAIKIIKPGMDSKHVIARFDLERQALAMMEHPGIARVFDAGATENGRPYFAMELVRGIPITEFCDQNRLPVVDRLQLFISVCEAIQHAHQKGIIHRDIKPSNVLVSVNNDKPEVKVIDFGIAKAIEQQLADQSLLTSVGQVLGTAEYMSPEQIEWNHANVDTRTDVYSLGIVFYELLTGETPFDHDRLRNGGFDEMRRIIQNEQPQRPSSVVRSINADACRAVEERWSTPVNRVLESLRGELDWIVMKAIEKEPNRRYATVNALIMDISRYLRNEPVVARPTSVFYRVKKFTQRNRLIVASFLVIACSLVAATIVSARFAFWAIESERRTEALQRDTAWQLYVSQMAQAVVAWEIHNYGALAKHLSRTRPSAELPDFRGWEWHFLANQSERPFVVTPVAHVEHAAWHPAKNEFAVVVRRATGGSAIETWEPGNRDPLGTVAEFPDLEVRAIKGLRWSGDGQYLAFATYQGRAVIVNASTGKKRFDKQVHSGTGYRSATRAFDLSRDGKFFVTASYFGQIRSWDVDSGCLLDEHNPADRENLSSL
ncbi:MAG: protein kinase, partial [Planctomycetales bacterium]|nr:protein kinase [Planctomycetales bacterium]